MAEGKHPLRESGVFRWSASERPWRSEPASERRDQFGGRLKARERFPVVVIQIELTAGLGGNKNARMSTAPSVEYCSPLAAVAYVRAEPDTPDWKRIGQRVEGIACLASKPARGAERRCARWV